MYKIIILKITSLFIILAMFSCNFTENDNTLRIAAASNLRYVLEEINIEFENETAIYVEMSAASSGKLTAQIQNGAPFDIFLSANKKYPFFLYENKFSINSPKLFCKGLLVYWTNKRINLKGDIQEIVANDIKKIAIPNPKNAPFGIAAVQALKATSIYGSIKTKIIFAENVSQISQYVLNKNVDVGFSSKSIVLSPKLKSKGKWLEVDESLYQPIEQFAMILKRTKNKKNAQLYFDFLFSKKAQEIFNKWGYKTK
ncbi:MAG: molybdate ABC transporter substrate-binding protein [Bacteroidetes bacterium 4572_117]|nr:MAG: molybdate ABC transporter substrate-binding protein [Bacteroidetes bacterium 4572_117]